MFKSLLSLFCLFLAGCNIVGAGAVVGEKIFGPAAVDAEYKLGTEPVLILVENYRNPLGALSDSEEVSQFVVDALHENLKETDKDKPAKINIIDPEKLLEYQNAHPIEYAKMKIPDIGRALGAKQVLYVDLMVSGVDATPGSELLRAKFAANVKVVDVATGQTRWPNDMAHGTPVAWESKPQRPTDEVYPAAVRERALRVGSDHIARLFYKWKPDDAPDDDELQAVPSI
ncbi:MAG TPA: hypothetical protein VFE58_13120 [Tepidisphaeraceae bacterium]|jgi:hypothetical protein|nr:hypothetical protein [Tepidisphaeraceae bacterium]